MKNLSHHMPILTRIEMMKSEHGRGAQPPEEKEEGADDRAEDDQPIDPPVVTEEPEVKYLLLENVAAVPRHEVLDQVGIDENRRR